MPKVGNTHFDYTPKGIAMAKNKAKKHCSLPSPGKSFDKMFDENILLEAISRSHCFSGWLSGLLMSFDRGCTPTIPAR